MRRFMARFGKTKIIIATIVLVLAAWAVYAFFFKSNTGQYQFITVKRGAITENVGVTGATTPITSIDLAFENGGTITAVNKDVGIAVYAGDVIVQLNTSDLRAQLAQAQANVDVQAAQLRSLQAGSRPEDIQASQAALDVAKQSLANMYANVGSALLDGYAKVNDAVRNQLTPFFSGAETNNPQLTFAVNNSQTMNDLISQRIAASTELNNWQNELAGIGSASPTSALDAALRMGTAHLSVVNNLLATAGQALLQESSLSTATLNAYKTALANALTEMNSATTNVSGAGQNIASQKITIGQLQAQLNLKLAGSTQDQIAAQQAQVEQAQASMASIQAKLTKASLVSPIDGVITVQNAKVGQIAAPGAVLVSIISDRGLEIDANIPETDIGKVKVNDPVDMTFDAFPGETFTGKVFFIDPAETIIQGVVDYKIKVSFDKADPRVKSGLTANLEIKTQEKSNVLVLPQFAILQTDTGSFVKELKNGVVTQLPVTLGIRDGQGNVEVVSGVSEGEQVLNIGLK